ncbi:MAG: glycosyl hydrolase 53 family protein [Saprospiraceae bacterium]|nr:glycosyl hydrolase 53 family protein [Saprospiraceae bacterium]
MIKIQFNMMFFKRIAFFLIACLAFSCSDDDDCCDQPVPDPLEVRGVDASFLPAVRTSGVAVLNAAGQAEDMLTTLQKAGVNTIRIRLWNNPASPTSSFAQVKALAAEVKNKGMKVWLCLHYSDTWADPGYQAKPTAWTGIGYEVLQDSVYQFTKKAAAEILPHYIQIGNEINGGLLWPEGNLSNISQMKTLINKGIQAVRDHSPATQIMIHYAGHQEAMWFFNQIGAMDYDIIALSYYPFWHGKNFFQLEHNMTQLANTFNKKVLIAETAYPFTLNWNDQTNNVIGLANQIHPEYPASAEGQRNFLLKLREVVESSSEGIGFCYWGAEWVAFKGNTATDGSSWENMALWDFNLRALPVMDAFKE